MFLRHHPRRSNDGKGFRRFIAGRRWRTPNHVGHQEAERRFGRIEDAWHDLETFCWKLGVEPHWTDVAVWAADHLRLGQLRIPLPPLDLLYGDYEFEAHESLRELGTRYTDFDTLECHLPKTVDDLEVDEADMIFHVMNELYPSANWVMPDFHRNEMERFHARQIRYSFDQLAKVKGEAPPDPSKPLVDGTLEEALDAYEQHRLDEGKPSMAKLVRAIKEHAPEVHLNNLDFTESQALLDLWRHRPESKKTGQTMAKKTCENHVGELKRFFSWLHLTNLFGWRKSVDHSELRASVEERPSDFPSVTFPPIRTFSTSELSSIVLAANNFDRLLLLWGLNCAHGAAEFGRVEWGDLMLHQSHPWIKEGLAYPENDSDSWVGFLRPKTKVLGWWYLWPETVQLLSCWMNEWSTIKNRPPEPNDRVLIDTKGVPMYRDEKRNAQSVFYNHWNKVLERSRVQRLPYGSLRNHLPDWLGGDQAKSVIASVALAHGIPHKGDRLLYRHYSNRPWAKLFEAQKAYRDHLSDMMESVEC